MIKRKFLLSSWIVLVTLVSFIVQGRDKGRLANADIGLEVFVKGKQHHAFFAGETVPLGLLVKNYSTQPIKLNAAIIVRDFYQNVVMTKKYKFMVPAGGEHTERLNFSTKLKGAFLVNGCLYGKRILLEDEAVFSILDKRPFLRGEEEAGLLGFHARSGDAGLLEAAKMAGFKWVRLHDYAGFATCWCVNEKQKGKWTFYDKTVKAYRDAGFHILGSLHRTPSWAADCPEIPGKPKNDFRHHYVYRKYPPREWKDYENYVRTVVKHYQPWIRHWEVWNEPDISGFWAATPEKYAELSKRTYKALREANPNAVAIGGGGLAPPMMPWVNAYLKAGGAKGADIISIHGYFDHVNPYSAKEAEHFFPRFQEAVIKYGGPTKIWTTEAPIGSNGMLSNSYLNQNQKTRTYKSHINTAYEVPKILNTAKKYNAKYFYYTLIADCPPRHCTFGANAFKQLKPTMAAINIWSAILEKADFLEDIKPDAHLIKGALFAGENGGSKAVIWGDFTDDLGIKLYLKDGNYQLLDVMGNPYAKTTREDGQCILILTHAPVYIVSSSLSPKQLKQRILTAKFEGEDVIRSRDRMRLASKKEFKAKPSERLQPFPETKGVNSTDWLEVNLRSHCNLGFADEVIGDGKGGWTDEGCFNDMRSMPLGKQLFCGVPFDIIDPAKNKGNSCIGLTGSVALLYPEAAKNIAVKAKLKELYFLNAACWSNGKDICLYCDVHYADGTNERIPIITADWWRKPSDTDATRAVRIDVENVIYLGMPRDRYLRIQQWKNPHPQKEIVSLDLISAKNKPVPITVAITGLRSQ